MRIRVGCEMAYELRQVTPMIVTPNVHSSRGRPGAPSGQVTPDRPQVPMLMRQDLHVQASPFGGSDSQMAAWPKTFGFKGISR